MLPLLLFHSLVPSLPGLLYPAFLLELSSSLTPNSLKLCHILRRQALLDQTPLTLQYLSIPLHSSKSQQTQTALQRHKPTFQPISSHHALLCCRPLLSLSLPSLSVSLRSPSSLGDFPSQPASLALLPPRLRRAVASNLLLLVRPLQSPR